MTNEKITRRGVYKDLSMSPYEYKSPYGDIFKFSSKKKLDIYTRDIVKEIDRLDKVMERHDLSESVPPEIVSLIYRTFYRCFYRRVEG